ncbi:hypothetical protein D9611_004415 [Ephemerocybe angulata]|uniref:Ndc10 domain-containing protein n=1 Tax=Ephemerocybe angulata TaxID=980116 RepID=A0A8H5BM41_9AGAR|nr:hypothetical protein D9611_004415 [Tulosesus angulatus]
MGRKKTFEGVSTPPPSSNKRTKRSRKARPVSKMDPSAIALSQTAPLEKTNTTELDTSGLIQMPPTLDDELDIAGSNSSSTVPPVLQAALNNPEAVSGAVANSTLANSLLSLEEEAALQSLARNQEMSSGKGTEPAYARQLERYESQWALREARRAEEALEKGLEYTVVPAHPITAKKVAIYAEEERKRERLDRHGNPIPNTCISWRTVTQAISALENYRFIHHRKDPRYINCPEAQIFLRNDPDVRSVEKAARQWDAQRQDSSQELKANGIQSQTFTEEQFNEVSVGLMSGKKTPCQMVALLRDRTMLLTSGTMALRGDNVRSVRLSDLSLRDVPLVNISHDFKAKAIIMFSNQGKTNMNGRIDEHSAFRHREPELCILNALAMYFFGLYHIEKRKPATFAPDWKHDKATQIGYREWYNILLFPGGKSDFEEMADTHHRKRVNHFKAQFDIFCEKVTHSGRVRAANVAIQNGATVDGTKSLGNWSQSGSFRACYNRVLPTDAMLALAGFNGERKDSYYIARDELKPPEQLVSAIFPWIEEEEVAYRSRLEDHGPDARDNALVYFLSLLRILRVILVQDLAVMAARHPDLFVLRFSPFNTEAFRNFARESSAILDTVEAEAMANLKHLPEQFAASVSGALKSTMIKQEKHRREVEQQNEDLRNDVLDLVKLLATCVSTEKSNKRKFSEVLAQRFATPDLGDDKITRQAKRIHLDVPVESSTRGELGGQSNHAPQLVPHLGSDSMDPQPTSSSTMALAPKAPAISGSGAIANLPLFYLPPQH